MSKRNATPRLHLENVSGEVGRLIGSAMPPGVGFALLIFDFGEKGNLAYISNAERTTMLESLREFIAKHEAGTVSSVRQS